MTPTNSDDAPGRPTGEVRSLARPDPDRTTDLPPQPAAGNVVTCDHLPSVSTAPDETLMERAPPSVSVPGYEIEGVLGRGGMGVVYKARHLTLKRTVALKMVRAGAHAGPQELARFRIEAEAVARLQHPNIVQIHEVGNADGHHYCALEFIDGGSLARKLDGKPLPAPEAAKLVEVLARAMHLAHSRNVVHRDLKPANILLTADGIPKISDFGLARQLDTDSGETHAGTVLGTPSYMAPEQASGNARDAGPPADVYALGAILYTCLTGRPPFKGNSVIETLDQVRSQEPIPPTRWQGSIHPDLEAVCLKCLEKNPAHRYASAQELAEDLERWCKGDATRVRPWSWRRHLARFIRRRWKPLVALLVLLTGAAFWFAIVWSDPDYRAQRALWRVDDAMKSGQRVALIGPVGPPKWSRPVFNSADLRLSTDPSSVFQFDANNPVMVELAPAAHHDRYRFSAEVLMRSSKSVDKVSSAGIYFAHNSGPADATGFAERVLIVQFNRNRLVLNRETDAVNVQDFLLLSRDGVTTLDRAVPRGGHTYTIDRNVMQEQEPWRYFEIEVTPETIRASWREGDGLQLIGVPNQVLKTVNPILTKHVDTVSEDRTTFLDKRYPNVPRRIEYKPRGALGLYVTHGVAEFRNVIYEPLPNEPAP